MPPKAASSVTPSRRCATDRATVSSIDRIAPTGCSLSTFLIAPAMPARMSAPSRVRSAKVMVGRAS